MAAEAQTALINALLGPTVASPGLTPRERALLAYADSLTLTPHENQQPFVESMRREGYDDLAIHDACAIIAYFAFVNRIADGLGVEIEQQSG